MRIGQTSAVVFLAKLLSTVFGFIATVYFARVLGPEVYGIYVLIVALSAWLSVVGNAGLSSALKKRLSEAPNTPGYLLAGLGSLVVTASLVAFGVILARPVLEAYLSGWASYVPLSVLWFVITLFVVRLSATLVTDMLHGQHVVHLAGMLDPIKTGLRAAVQLLLVLAGLHLLGMVLGYIIGVALAVCIGLVFVRISYTAPTREEVGNLVDYAKYAWVDDLKSRSYQDIDILILGALVATPLVGIYAIAWSFIKLLKLFGQSVGHAVFPVISFRASQTGNDAAIRYIEDALAYGGFIAIPGAVGGTILAERLLLIFGSAYVDGTAVLWLLLWGVLFWAYFRQCINALNALDRPDLAFRANAVFVLSNILLTIGLVHALGWTGAALASLVTTTIGFVMAFWLLRHVVSVSFPTPMVAKQFLAAGMMGMVVLLVDLLVRQTEGSVTNIVVLVLLLILGVLTYCLSMVAISAEFRRLTRSNLSLDEWTH